MNASQLAIGKWREILVSLGVPSTFLTGKHGPCPLCNSGRDRWRFDNKDGKGTYICSHCGAGDGFDLAIKYTGKAFAEVAAEVERLSGSIKPERPRKKRDPKVRLRQIGSELQHIGGKDPVSLYLKGRGITGIASYALRLHPSLLYWEQGQNLGNHPAMVAKIENVHGQIESFHTTYLTPDGQKAAVPSAKKILPPVNSISGGAIRLAPMAEHIAITEGIENALAVMEGEGLPCWACVSANGIETFQAPNGIKRVSIYGDNDTSFTGQAAAYTLAKRLHREGIAVDVCISPNVGTDYLDSLIRSRRAAA